MEPDEFISQAAWEKLSIEEQNAYLERFSESIRAVLQGRNFDRALVFSDRGGGALSSQIFVGP